MKLTSGHSHVKTTGFTETKEFSVSESPMFFKLMSKNLYKKPELAIVRELSANAMDSHIQAGNGDKPFEIFFPTTKSPYFVIRDYGVGLSKDDANNLYSNFFASNKRASNKYAGCFGLGSKTPLAISDSFTIESVHKSKKYVWVCHLNDEGIPCLSTTNSDGEHTEEPSGVRITVPVKSSSISEFSSIAPTIFQFYKTKPKSNVSYEEPNYVYETETFKIQKGSWTTEFYAVMGGIKYPIDQQYLKFTYPEFNYYTTYMDFPIGSLSVETSREGLHYDEKTKKKISEVFQSLKTQVLNEMQDAQKGLVGWDLTLKQIELSQKFKFMGYEHPVITVTESDNVSTIHTMKSTYQEKHSIRTSNTPVFFIKDIQKGYVKALWDYSRIHKVNPYIIENDSPLITRLGLEPKHLKLLSSVIQKTSKDRVGSYNPRKQVCEIVDGSRKSEAFRVVQNATVNYYVLRKGSDILFGGQPRNPDAMSAIHTAFELGGITDTVYATLDTSQGQDASKVALEILQKHLTQDIVDKYYGFENNLDTYLIRELDCDVIKDALTEYSDIDEFWKKTYKLIKAYNMLGGKELQVSNKQECKLQKIRDKYPFLKHLGWVRENDLKEISEFINKCELSF
jgi:hypothetical protein